MALVLLKKKNLRKKSLKFPSWVRRGPIGKHLKNPCLLILKKKYFFVQIFIFKSRANP